MGIESFHALNTRSFIGRQENVLISCPDGPRLDAAGDDSAVIALSGKLVDVLDGESQFPRISGRGFDKSVQGLQHRGLPIPWHLLRTPNDILPFPRAERNKIPRFKIDLI